MIREVLPSDVEFARGMITSSHSDAEILTILASRGIEPAKAAQLVDDLRHGRKPSWQLPFSPTTGAPAPITKAQASVPIPPPAAPAPRHRPYRRIHKRQAAAWWFLILLLIFAWAFGYAFLHLGSDASRDAAQKVRHEVPPAPNKQ
jgi:hypothetical protein